MSLKKRGLSPIIAYILLITLVITMSFIVYAWMKTYVVQTDLECPSEGVSLFVKDINCSFNGANTELKLEFKNTGKFNLEGYLISATNKSNSEFTSRDLTEFLISGGTILNPGQAGVGLGVTGPLEPDEEETHIYVIPEEYDIKQLKITPFMFEKVDNTLRRVLCTNSESKEIVDCGIGGTSETTRGSITRDYWTGISGSDISDLTSDSNYPDNPTGSDTLTTFEAVDWNNPSIYKNWADHYGQRIYGYIYPPITGSYKFYIASDNQGELWLSTDDSPSNIGPSPIAEVPAWTNAREWDKYPEQESNPISLVAGQKYYIEALQKEHEGGDSLSVAWIGPWNENPEIIPGNYLSPQPPLGTLTASPNPCTIASGETKCTTTLSYTSNLPFVQLRYTPQGGVEGNVECLWGASGTKDINWVGTNNIKFSIYAVDACGPENLGTGTLLDEVTVSGVEEGTTFSPEEIIEAEDGDITSPMTIGTSGSDQYIYSTVDYAGGAVTDTGSVSYNFTITEPGIYKLEAKVQAPSGADNSFYVGLDSEPANGDSTYSYDINPYTATFTWEDVSKRGTGDDGNPEFDPKTWDLSAGEHTFTFYGREDGTWLDQIRLVKVVETPSVLNLNFNEGSLADSSGNNNDATNNGATYTASGKVGGARVFDGSSSYLEIPNDPSLNPSEISISAWVYLTAYPSPNSGDIVSKDKNNGYRFRVNNGKTISWFDQGCNSACFTTSYLVPLNTWVNIITTAGSSGQKIYIDGIEKANTTTPYSGPVSTGTLKIGAEPFYGEYFNGTIDEVKIWNRSLSYSEVQSVYNSYG